MTNQAILGARFNTIRKRTEALCSNLITEDYSIQPSDFASPPKWHLAHVTWFWEQFVLGVFKANYKVFHEDFSFLFNSYYNNVGKRVLRPTRGLMTRPSVESVYEYRAYVDAQMNELFAAATLPPEALSVIEIGINHEEQHQELFLYDIKYILGNQPQFPAYGKGFEAEPLPVAPQFFFVEAGVYEVGHQGATFCFDNELNRHKVYLQNFEIAQNVVTNAEYIEFMVAGGYENFNYWHDDGWHWVNNNHIKAPLYWHEMDGKWQYYDLDGLKPVELSCPLKHISFYEAAAFAEWKGMRLPTEFEWEVASDALNWGHVWEWTYSGYLPYPGYSKASGALGEYNGKFMVNQMVLRGASIATAPGHSRKTYRNFFHPDMRWQYAGIRLAKTIKSL